MTELSPEVAAHTGSPSTNQVSATDGMRPPGSQLPLFAYLQQLWSLRHYAIVVGKSRVESVNANTSLGKFWLVGEPIMFIAVYWTIFGIILGANRGVDNFIGFLASGQMLFRHNAQGIQSAGKAMTSFEIQIQNMPVPRALFPISAVVTTFFTLVPSFAVMCTLLLLTGETPGPEWLFIVPIVAGQLVLNIGIGSFFARAVAHIPDLSVVMTHVFRSALYLSGAVFPIGFLLGGLENGPRYVQALAVINPMFDYLELGRWALMDIQPSHPRLSLLCAAVWTLVTPLIGVLWLRGAERRFGFGQIRNAP